MIREICLRAAALAMILLGASEMTSAQPPAKQPRAVLELFTSQGCSSCPAADAILVELARDPELIALTLPVTYWDYLGWKDTLGQDTFTRRQRHYAKSRGDGQIYTPQLIINGGTHMVGSDRELIRHVLAEQDGHELPVAVGVAEEAGVLRIALSPTGEKARQGGEVWVLPISRSATVLIERGENKGRSLVYANVVRAISKVGEWHGEATMIAVPLSVIEAPRADAYVVLVQQAQPGRAILGAARGPR